MGIAGLYRAELRLNAVAAATAAIGMLNVYLSWHVFGLSAWADAWMTALVIVQCVGLFVQAGVEQCGVHTLRLDAESDERLRGEFRSACFSWALCSGLLGGLLVCLSGPLLLHLFAAKLAPTASEKLLQLLSPLALQVVAMPLIYVLRQQLLIASRNLGAAMTPAIVSVPLALSLLIGQGLAWTPVTMAWLSGLSALGVSLLVCRRSGWVGLGLSAGVRKSLWRMVVQSVKMRMAHSMHNFLVTAFISSLLSGLGEGVLALYQYLKRIADGLTGVLLGPAMAIYGVEQNKVLLDNNRIKLLTMSREYRQQTMLRVLPVGLLALVWVVASLVTPWLGTTETALLFSLLVLWQLVIACEYAAVAWFVSLDAVWWIFGINSVYLLAFAGSSFLVQHYWPTAPNVLALAVACQMVSLWLYTVLGHKLLRRREQYV